MSKGVLQHDMWGVKEPSTRWDWTTLRADIAQHGVRNSLLVAPMPTASTSQVISYHTSNGLLPSYPYIYLMLLLVWSPTVPTTTMSFASCNQSKSHMGLDL